MGSVAGQQKAFQGHLQVKKNIDLLSLLPPSLSIHLFVHPSICPSIHCLGTTLRAHQLQEGQRADHASQRAVPEDGQGEQEEVKLGARGPV